MSITYKISLGIICGLIIIGTFFDQQIASAMTGHFNIYFRFFEIFGDIPMLAGLSTITIYLAIMMFKSSSTKFKILSTFTYILGLALSYMLFFITFRYLNPEGGHSGGKVSLTMNVVATILGLIYAIIITILLYKKNYKELLRHRNTAVFAIVMILTVLVGTNIIKVIWGRPRIWLVEDELAEFRPWYLPKPFATGNEYMSFISGHTSNASLMILVTLIPISVIQDNKKKFFIFGITWGLLTGVSRLFAGQHYLTDVTFAVLYVGVLYYILARKFDIEKK